ncbi:MAG: M81 family metallopeptidase [Chloroflexota bacterium]
MPKILVGECKQEVSSFNPVLSSLSDFEILWGQPILDYHHNVQSEMNGALQVFAQHPDLEIIPTYSARSITSGGTLRTDSLAMIKQDFVEAVRTAPTPDAVYLSLHGAMGAEGEDDPEGLLLSEIRQIIGELVPIVVSMDLHGVLTPRILKHADAVVAYHTYPHVDFYSTGERAARLLLKILFGKAKPVTARVYIPALVRGPELITETGRYGNMIRQAQAAEMDERGLSAGLFIGNPFTDVLDLATNSFVVSDGDEGWARQQALSLANLFWEQREHLNQPLISVDEALDIAKVHLNRGTVIFVDAADATSSGASGDSNVILRSLIENEYAGSALIPIVDAPAVRKAMKAGVGAEIDVTLGGQLDTARFTPLSVKATVRMISDGHFISESNGAIWNGGHSAVLQIGNLTVIATSRPVSLYDRSLFYGHGQNPQHFDAVVVKSPHCQEHMFAAWAATMLNVDAPGSTSANLPYLGHTRCRRPMFPLDTKVTFEPQLEIYRRD